MGRNPTHKSPRRRYGHRVRVRLFCLRDCADRYRVVRVRRITRGGDLIAIGGTHTTVPGYTATTWEFHVSIAESDIIRQAFDYTWEVWPEHAAKILSGVTAPGTRFKGIYFYQFDRSALKLLFSQNEAVEVEVPTSDHTLRFFEVKIYENEGEIEATSLFEAVEKGYPLFADRVGDEWRIFTAAAMPPVEATQIRIVLQPFPGAGMVIPEGRNAHGPLMIKEWYLHHPRFETPITSGAFRVRTCDALVRLALSHPEWIVVRRWTRSAEAVAIDHFFRYASRFIGLTAH